MAGRLADSRVLAAAAVTAVAVPRRTTRDLWTTAADRRTWRRGCLMTERSLPWSTERPVLPRSASGRCTPAGTARATTSKSFGLDKCVRRSSGATAASMAAIGWPRRAAGATGTTCGGPGQGTCRPRFRWAASARRHARCLVVSARSPAADSALATVPALPCAEPSTPTSRCASSLARASSTAATHTFRYRSKTGGSQTARHRLPNTASSWLDTSDDHYEGTSQCITATVIERIPAAKIWSCGRGSSPTDSESRTRSPSLSKYCSATGHSSWPRIQL